MADDYGKIKRIGMLAYRKIRYELQYFGLNVAEANKGNEIIKQFIESAKPGFVGRIGAVESRYVSSVIENRKPTKSNLRNLELCAGVFPLTDRSMADFYREYTCALSQTDIFVAWEQWLSYLDNEVMYANTHYLTNDNSDFFLHYKFPEVVKEVKPSENADFSVEEIRFQVDENGTLWDILTKSIYTNEFDYIRELVQNAIDATLLKMYSDTNVSLPHQSPRSWNCTDKVMIAYSQKDGVLWVEDYGIGMNEKELSNYLFKTAKSGYQNMGKRTFEFPAIAKFGIGFASCLTKADEIQVGTTIFASFHEIITLKNLRFFRGRIISWIK